MGALSQWQRGGFSGDSGPFTHTHAVYINNVYFFLLHFSCTHRTTRQPWKLFLKKYMWTEENVHLNGFLLPSTLLSTSLSQSWPLLTPYLCGFTKGVWTKLFWKTEGKTVCKLSCSSNSKSPPPVILENRGNKISFIKIPGYVQLLSVSQCHMNIVIDQSATWLCAQC